MNLQTGSHNTDYDPYQLLRAYTYYRLFLGALLLLTHESNIITHIPGSEYALLFRYTCWVYIGINLLSLIFLWRNKHTPSLQQRFLAVFVDILAITLWMHASGGVGGGLGYLFLVAVAAAGMLLPVQLAIFSAALATIALLSDSLWQYFTQEMTNTSLFVSGYLGILIFITTFAFQYITRKIRHGKAEVLAQQRHVAHLQKLARLIVERMRTGIVVLNKNNDIELINQAAKELLNFDQAHSLNLSLKQSPDLLHQVQQWQNQTSAAHATSIVSGSKGAEIRLNMTELELGVDTSGTLIFAEDNRALTQQAQQLKLASLGRLTASIAHEIRNPLGAIGHASQLLAESSDLNTHDQRLLEIISNHTRRINQIIENIFQVSRRKTSEPELIKIDNWLPNFLKAYLQAHTQSHLSQKIAILNADSDLAIRFDESQLQQVVTNLLDNALRYADFSVDGPAITLRSYIDTNRQTPCLQIIDNGPGIEASQQVHIFEPFFTTESSGSGLGLFLCKELCEANQAFLSYTKEQDSHSCFTIQFAHPNKSQE